MSTIKLPIQSSYPRKVYFADECYRVKFKKRLNCYGKTDPQTKTIWIKDGLSPRALLQTFIHEVLHVVEFEEMPKLSHRQVYVWEKVLTELLIDNFFPLLVR